MDAYQLFSWLPSRLPSPHFGGCAQSKLTKSTVHLILTYSVPWWSMSTIARSNSSNFEFESIWRMTTPTSQNWYLTTLSQMIDTWHYWTFIFQALVILISLDMVSCYTKEMGHHDCNEVWDYKLILETKLKRETIRTLTSYGRPAASNHEMDFIKYVMGSRNPGSVSSRALPSPNRSTVEWTSTNTSF